MPQSLNEHNYTSTFMELEAAWADYFLYTAQFEDELANKLQVISEVCIKCDAVQRADRYSLK